MLGLGTVLLSGCSFTPMTFSTETAPTPSGNVDPTVTLDPEFFGRGREGSQKTLLEGTNIEQRFSTPHLDGTLKSFFVGERLSETSASQVGRDTPVRAPEGYEVAAFTLEGGRPTFIETPGNEASVHLRIGDRRIEIPNLFNTFNTMADAYLTPWEMLCFCLPLGSDLALEITDAGKNITLDLRTGVPVQDDGWLSTTGFREKWDVTCDPVDDVFTRGFVTLPPAGQEVEGGEMLFGLRPTALDGLRPWTPAQGWAGEGKQWLTVAMDARVTWKGRTTPDFTLLGPQSFVLTEPGSAAVPAIQPESIRADQIVAGQAELVVVWPVSGQEGASSFSFDPVGELRVDYAEAPGVAAEFTSPAEPLKFTLTMTPQR